METYQVATTLEGLQSHLTSKSQDLDAAANTIKDLNTKLTTLEKDLELAKDREMVFSEEANSAGTLQKEADLKS